VLLARRACLRSRCSCWPRQRNTALFARGYDTLLLLNGVLVGVLILIVVWQLLQLRRKLKRGVSARGSRPVSCCCSRWSRCCRALVYAVSVAVIGPRSSWFDVRVDRALEGA